MLVDDLKSHARALELEADGHARDLSFASSGRERMALNRADLMTRAAQTISFLSKPTPDGADNAGLMNVALENALAHAETEQDRQATLAAWMMLGTEYLAREFGRLKAQEIIQNLGAFVRDARPNTPWRD
jgi:hypothetical protein